MNIAALKQQLVEHESLRLRPYVDCCGRGWRVCVDSPCKAAREGQRGALTIGVGRNLDANGISEGEADMLLGNDVASVGAQLDQRAPWWRTLDEVRARVFAELLFNLGWTRLAKFRNTLSALRAGDHEDTARGMIASKWYGQVGRRGPRLVAMMRSGKEVPL